MVFSDPVFLLVYLPLTVILFYTLSMRNRYVTHAILLAASILFYLQNSTEYTVLLLVSILVNYVCATFILIADDSRSVARRSALWLGQIYNISTLVYFKYLIYFSETAGTGSEETGLHLGYAIPAGISFYTFHQAVFLVDAFAREKSVVAYMESLNSHLGKVRGLLKYSVFVAFFPQLVIGPIVYLKEVQRQFDSKNFGRFRYSNLAVGLTLISIGLAKKVLIADSLEPWTTATFNAASGQGGIDTYSAWIGALTFYVQLYFDFSGYTDMALGLARLFGIRLPFNFDSPLKASGIMDYYKRWHITLTRVIARFLYTPLSIAGTRLAMRKNVIGVPRRILIAWLPILVNFEIIALWHGATRTFIAFGLLHGIWYLVESELTSGKRWKAFWKNQNGLIVWLLPRVFFFFAMMVTFALFRSQSLEAFGNLIAAMAGFDQGVRVPLADINMDAFFLPATYAPWVLLSVYLLVYLAPNSMELLGKYRPGIQTWQNANYTPQFLRLSWRPSFSWALYIAVLYGFCLYLTTIRVTPFIYAGF